MLIGPSKQLPKTQKATCQLTGAPSPVEAVRACTTVEQVRGRAALEHVRRGTAEKDVGQFRAEAEGVLLVFILRQPRARG